MKKILLTVFMMTAIHSYAFAFRSKRASAGVVLGTPTGLSTAYRLDKINQIQADISSDYISADYMWRDRRNFGVKNLRWLYGAGLVAHKGLFGPRVVTATQYKISRTPFHLLANISFAFTDKSRLGAAIGARFDF